MALSPEEFVKRLDAISESDGVPYRRAHLLFDEEQKHQQAILQYKGYLALSDAFKCFFLETVELINTVCRPKVTAPLSEFYGIFVPRLAHGFQSLCGAERVAIFEETYVSQCRGKSFCSVTKTARPMERLLVIAATMRNAKAIHQAVKKQRSTPVIRTAIGSPHILANMELTSIPSGMMQKDRPP